MKNYLRLLQFIRPYIWPHATIAILCMIAYGVSGGGVTYLTKRIFDDIFSGKNQAALSYLPFAIVGIFAFRGLASFGQGYLMAYVNGRVVADIRKKMNAHVLTLSMSFFHRNPTSNLVARMTYDVDMAAGGLTGAVVSLVSDSVSLIVLTTVAFIMDPLLASIAIVAFPASVLPVMKMARTIRKFTKRGAQTVGGFIGLMQETIQGARIVRAFGMEEYEDQRLRKEIERLFKFNMRTTRIRVVVTPAMELLSACAIGGVIWYGGYSVIAGTRTQGQFMAFMAAMFLMYQPVKKLAGTNTAIQQGLVAVERIFEILDTQPEVQEKPNAGSVAPFSREIEFDNVSFGYGGKPVLQNIDLKIRKGEMVALVGVSGVGKSTLADLIPRFYDPTAGRILIDGIDVRDVTLSSLRSQIGIVSQHTFLFNDTVRNNIAYGDRAKNADHIVAAAKAAYAHDFIMGMPNGYDTGTGELGAKISGGERQRISIARALLKDPPILILDEATSALDSESERLVQEALERLMVGRTTLVIAHRLSTIRKADRIVVLVDGAIGEQGTHDELLALKGEYSKLYNLQFFDSGEQSAPPVLH